MTPIYKSITPTRTLTRLYGELSPTLSNQLRQLTLAQLRQAVDVAFERSTVAEFEATVTDWLSSNPTLDLRKSTDKHPAV